MLYSSLKPHSCHAVLLGQYITGADATVTLTLALCALCGVHEAGHDQTTFYRYCTMAGAIWLCSAVRKCYCASRRRVQQRFRKAKKGHITTHCTPCNISTYCTPRDQLSTNVRWGNASVIYNKNGYRAGNSIRWPSFCDDCTPEVDAAVYVCTPHGIIM